MFVDYSVELNRPERTVAGLLMSHGAVMEGMGAAAYRRGEELRSRVGPRGPLAKEVVISLGQPFMSRHGAVLPVRWRATGAEALFPRLDGELSVQTRGPQTSIIELRATYQPPLGTIGDLMDRAVLARLARSTVKDWVDRIAEWVETESGDREYHLDSGSRSDH